MTGIDDYYTWLRKWQNPGAVAIPEELNIPPGNMMPPTGKPNALRSINPKQPMAFSVPDVSVPPVPGSPMPPAPKVIIPSAPVDFVPPAPVASLPPPAPPAQISTIPPPVAKPALSISVEPSLPTTAIPTSAPAPVSTTAQPARVPVAGEVTPAQAHALLEQSRISPPPNISQVEAMRAADRAAMANNLSTTTTATPPFAPTDNLSRFAQIVKGVANGVAGSVVPGLAGNFASQVQAIEHPQLSDADMLYLAETDPTFYATNKEAIDGIIEKQRKARPINPLAKKQRKDSQNKKNIQPGQDSVTPSNPAPIVPTSVGIPTDDLSRNTSPDRIDPSAERRGQQNTFEQPLFEKSYQPTNFNGVLYKTDDFGQTNYQHPKGSMTFQGGAMDFPGRQGGGTLSVLGGRSKEEQAGIDQRVAEINSQTDALRALKGKPSLAEEARMQRIQSVMDQMMPNIDTTYLNDQQRAALEFQQNQLRTGLTQQLMELEDAKQKNSSANEFAALKFAAERGDAQAQQRLNEYKLYLDALDRGQGRTIDAARVKIDQGRLDQGRRNAIDKRIESYMGRDENDQPVLIPKVFEDKRHVQPLGDGKNTKPGLVYKLPNGMYGMVNPETGELMENMTIVDVESVLN